MGKMVWLNANFLFWAYAFATSALLINRMPTPAPYYSFLKIFDALSIYYFGSLAHFINCRLKTSQKKWQE
jgi:hypothetical protein